MRAICRALVLLTVVFFIGCSDFQDVPVGSRSGGGGQTTTDQPPGVVVNTGSGRVLSPEDAFDRVAVEYLGIPLARQFNARGGNPIIGGQGQPSYNLYQVPNGPLNPGTAVAEWDSLDESFLLPERYYLFWVDPNPRAKLGHLCSLLYLRERDGLLIEQRVDFDPGVDGVRVLDLPSQKLDNLCYTHQIWIDRGVSPLSPITTRVQAPIQAQGVGQAGGPGFHALGVVGHTDFTSDIDKFQDYFTGVGGDIDDFDPLADAAGDRLTEEDLRQALIDANEGLGPDDKFLFCLSSHGSTDGEFCLGNGSMSWQELCLLLDQTVTAGNLNIIIDTCYAGQAAETFAGWTSTRRVRLVTGTGSNTVSYDGTNLDCLLAELLALAEVAAANGELTLNELEKTFSDVDLTLKELEEKLCADLDTEADRKWKEDVYNADPTSGGVKLGSDPDPGEGVIVKFFRDWAARVSAEDQLGLLPFYSPTYFYNGQDAQDVTDFSAEFDIEVSEVDDVIITDGDVFRIAPQVTIVSGPITQHEERVMEFRLDSGPNRTPPFTITSQRVLSQQTTGTFGNRPPSLPTPPHIDSGALNEISGLTLAPGDPLAVTVRITGLSERTAPGQSSRAGLALGGETFLLAPQGNDTFRGTVIVPTLVDGAYVLELFAENRVTDPATNDQAYAGTSRSAEINIGK